MRIAEVALASLEGVSPATHRKLKGLTIKLCWCEIGARLNQHCSSCSSFPSNLCRCWISGQEIGIDVLWFCWHSGLRVTVPSWPLFLPDLFLSRPNRFWWSDLNNRQTKWLESAWEAVANQRESGQWGQLSSPLAQFCGNSSWVWPYWKVKRGHNLEVGTSSSQ